MLITSVLTLSGFYPRHPRGWRLEGNTLPVIITIVSIHATLAGGDVIATRFKWCLNAFLSTPPSRVATAQQHHPSEGTRRFYPRHPRGWRPGFPIKNLTAKFVSIHATLAGGDFLCEISDCLSCVSIHATLAGGDASIIDCFLRKRTFLSTPPSRVATV